MLATGCTLSEFLDALCRLIEDIASGSLCGIVLVDPISNRLKHGAAPSLPLSYNESIHGRPVNLFSGPCAMAACLKEQVIAADVASDTRWDTYEWRSLAMAHGLRACWSTPILSSNEKVLGTFAIYSREPGSPTAQDQHLIGQITHLATGPLSKSMRRTSSGKARKSCNNSSMPSLNISSSWGRMGVGSIRIRSRATITVFPPKILRKTIWQGSFIRTIGKQCWLNINV